MFQNLNQTLFECTLKLNINMFKKIIISGLLPMLCKIDKYPASSAKANHQCQIKIHILCCLFLGHRYGCVFVIAC